MRYALPILLIVSRWAIAEVIIAEDIELSDEQRSTLIRKALRLDLGSSEIAKFEAFAYAYDEIPRALITFAPYEILESTYHVDKVGCHERRILGWVCDEIFTSRHYYREDVSTSFVISAEIDAGKVPLLISAVENVPSCKINIWRNGSIQKSSDGQYIVGAQAVYCSLVFEWRQDHFEFVHQMYVLE